MNPLVLLNLVPRWVLAALLAASIAHGCVVSGQRDSSRLAHGLLKTAVAEQKAEASAELAAAGARVLETERKLSSARAQQELKSAKDQNTVAALRGQLRDMSRAGGGPGLRDPHSEAGGGSSGGGAGGAAAATASDSAVDGAKTGGVLSAPLEELFLRITREADEINLAYAACRADSISIRAPAEVK